MASRSICVGMTGQLTQKRDNHIKNGTSGHPTLGRPKRRLEGNIEVVLMVLREVGCEGMECIQLDQDRVHWGAFMGMKINLWIP
jgi:hypothetical protein